MALENYILPFVGNAVVISQGYNGPLTHKKIRENTDQSYSLDFALPLGTDVLASREGTVKFACDRFNRYYEGSDFEIGSTFMANFIEVKHDDGTIACYQHFAKGSINSLGIKNGVRVKQGQVLGKTGLSGWIGDVPHLHFMVYEKKAMQYEDRMKITKTTKPVKFENYDGPLEHKDLLK